MATVLPVAVAVLASILLSATSPGCGGRDNGATKDTTTLVGDTTSPGDTGCVPRVTYCPYVWKQAPCPRHLAHAYMCDPCRTGVYYCAGSDDDPTLRWHWAEVDCDCVNADGTLSTAGDCGSMRSR